ncbi:MAG: PAS domain S-box protein [Candidatus Omnitrophota bacterium]
MGIARLWRCGIRLLIFVILIGYFAETPLSLFAQPASSNFPLPIERSGQNWRLSSLLEDGGLSDRYVTFIDFEKDNSAVWISTSSGLYWYDGFVWKHYLESDGLPSSLVRCVCIAQNGRVWFGTDREAGFLEGEKAVVVGVKDGLAGPSVRRIVEDPDGTLWFCCDRWPDASVTGGLSSLHNGIWTVYGEKDGLPSDHVMDYFRDSKGRQFVLTLKGLAQKEGEGWFSPLEREGFQEAQKRFWSIAEDPETGVMASTDDEMFILKEGHWSRRERQDNYLPLFLCSTRAGEIISCAYTGRDQLSFAQWKNDTFERISVFYQSPPRQLNAMREAPDGSIWCVGFDYLVRWNRVGREWTEYENLPPPRFVDGRGRVWFIGDRNTIRLDGETWEPVDFTGSAAVDSKGGVWGWSDGDISYWSGQEEKKFGHAETGMISIQGFIPDKSGKSCFFGIDDHCQNAAVVYDGSSWKKTTPDDIRDGTIIQGVSDPLSGVWMMLCHYEAGSMRLVKLDGDRVETHVFPYGVRAFDRPFFSIDSKFNLWLTSHFQMYRSKKENRDEWERLPEFTGGFWFAAEESGDSVWLGCDGFLGGRSGLMRFRDGVFTAYEASVRRFGSASSDGSAIFSGDGSLYIVSPNSLVAPIKITIPTYGSVNTAIMDKEGRYWMDAGMGVDDTVFCFQSDKIPPDTLIVSSETDLYPGQILQARVSGSERFKPRGDEKAYLYSWRIDSGEWSDFRYIQQFLFPVKDFKTGSHMIQVRAQDEGFDIDPTPAEFYFNVMPIPLRERPWFFPSIAILSLLILLLAVYALAARRKLAAIVEKLEETVVIRTAEIREKEENLRKVIQNMPILLDAFDENRNVIVWNRECENVTGYKSEEIIGHPRIFRLLFPNGEHYEQIMKGLFEEKEDYRDRERYTLCKDGGVKIVSWSNISKSFPIKGWRAWAVGVDITERKKAEEALRENERMLSMLMSNLPGMVYRCRFDKDWTMEFISEGCMGLTGFPPSDLIHNRKKSFNDIIHPDDQTPVWDNVHSALRERRPYELTYRIIAANGSEKWVWERGQGVFTSGGEILFLEGFITDITERKNLEEQLRHSHRMEAIGQLAGGVAHDFNNILVAILGYSDISLAKSSLDESVRKHIEEIKKAGLRAESLTRQLLAFSRKQVLQPRIIDLNALILDMDKMLRRLIGEDIDLVTIPDPSLNLIEADPGQIEQVIVNLAVNSRDAMPDGGKLTIETMNIELDERYARIHVDARPGSHVMLAISDTGAGIDKKTQKHIFEPFFTTKPKGKGTGLGLSTVYGIVKQSGGNIWVYSEVGQGTTFKIYFPKVESTRIVETSALPPASTSRCTETILVVEDDEIVRRLIARTLSDSGYDVLQAISGDDALQKYDSLIQPIHLLVTDVIMPGISGRELSQRLTPIYPQMKTLYVSGYTDNAIVHHGVLEPGLHFLQKPFIPDALRRKVREVLGA